MKQKQARARHSFKRWHAIHTWTSLVCTAFLLLLCLTGLPLIFHHEIDDALGNNIDAPPMAAGTAHAGLDRIDAAGRAQKPGNVVQYMIWEADAHDVASLVMAPRPDTKPDDTHTVVVDMRTAAVLGEPQFSQTLTFILLKLHTDMFAGLAGKLFLGFMGILFIVSIISGILVYGPLMKKIDFGSVRKEKGSRIKWLDLHNLLGIATVAWVLVVGVTGVIASVADLVLQAWRTDQLAAMVAPYAGKSPPARLVSLERAAVNARLAAPGMVPSFIAYPGTVFSSAHHYAFFMRGESALTRHLLKPVLIDAETAEITAVRDLPWYMTGMLVAKPLHFGDYGGMPLKIFWGLLDAITVVVLGSGLYLWLARRKQTRARLDKLDAAHHA